MKAFINFSLTKNKTFKNFLYNEVKWGLLTYFKKFLSNNHKIINCALTYDDSLLNSNHDENVIFIDDLIAIAKLTNNEHQVVNLKQEGYNITEIMAYLNLSYKQVDNAWTRAKLKLKQCYQNYL